MRALMVERRKINSSRRILYRRDLEKFRHANVVFEAQLPVDLQSLEAEIASAFLSLLPKLDD